MTSAKPKQSMQDFTTGDSARPDDVVSTLLPVLARRKATGRKPVMAGASFFFELPSGWESRLLSSDKAVRLVRTTDELEEAFVDVAVHTIFIPEDASVTKNVAIRVCGRHGQGKTVFFEVNENEQG